MKDYNINFQEIIDNFSLEELATFKMRLDKELDKRIDAKKKQIEKEVLAILKGRTDLIDSLKESYIKTTEGEIIMWKKKIKKELNK